MKESENVGERRKEKKRKKAKNFLLNCPMTSKLTPLFQSETRLRFSFFFPFVLFYFQRMATYSKSAVCLCVALARVTLGEILCFLLHFGMSEPIAVGWKITGCALALVIGVQKFPNNNNQKIIFILIFFL